MIIVNTVGLVYDGITNIMMSYIKTMDKNGMDIYIVSTIKAEPGIVEQLKRMVVTLLICLHGKKHFKLLLWACKVYS